MRNENFETGMLPEVISRPGIPRWRKPHASSSVSAYMEAQFEITSGCPPTVRVNLNTVLMAVRGVRVELTLKKREVMAHGVHCRIVSPAQIDGMWHEPARSVITR